ncbi:hypothetical protein INT47_003093, partial [Mucor saturninus]
MIRFTISTQTKDIGSKFPILANIIEFSFSSVDPKDLYTSKRLLYHDDESEEQMEDVAYQYGDIKKIIDFDLPPTEIPKVDTTMR